MNSLKLEGGCGVIEKVRGISERGKKKKERSWGVKVQKMENRWETDQPQKQPPTSCLGTSGRSPEGWIRCAR